MSTTTAPDRNAQILYGRWEKPRSTGLFGMTWPVTVLCGGLLIGLILTFLFTSSLLVVGAGLALAALGVVPLVFSKRGRTGWELIAMRARFQIGKWRKHNVFRGGTFGKVPGVGMMPGMQGHTDLYEYELSGGGRFGLIHLRGKNHYTVVLQAQAQGQERVDQWQINQWVGGWDKFLAHLGTSQGVLGASVVIDSMPDTGQRISSEVRRLTSPKAPPFARQVMAETALHRSSAAVRSEFRIAITFSRLREATSKEVADQGAAIGRHISIFKSRAAGAGLDAKPMTAGDLCAVATRSFRPELHSELERMTHAGEQDQLRWDCAGPTTAIAEWGSYRHNGYTSVSWEMSNAPSGQVPADTLSHLLAPRADLARKRIAICYRVHNVAEAVKLVDSDFREALAAEQAKSGLASAAASLRVDNTRDARIEQARGAGLTRFGSLVTLTAPCDADFPALTAEMEGLADASRIHIERAWGWQDSAFSGSMALGLVLPEMASVTSQFGK